MKENSNYEKWHFVSQGPLKPGIYWVKDSSRVNSERYAKYKPGIGNDLYWDVPPGFNVTHWQSL